MCWNYQVSLSFSILYFLINCYYVLKKPPYWKEYLMFGAFYFTMEVFQSLQWLYGNVYMLSDQSEQSSFVSGMIAKYGVHTCNITNSHFTMAAHILIWLQPILFSYIGYRTVDSSSRKFMKYQIWVNCTILVQSSLQLLSSPSQGNPYTISGSIFGLSMCTNEGDTGHLVWRFKPLLIEYFPNYLAYLTMCVLAFLCYDKAEIKIIGYGWFASLLITAVILRPTLLEYASAWCLFSIVANAMILCVCLRTQNRKYPLRSI
jgi:hypothetical protein